MPLSMTTPDLVARLKECPALPGVYHMLSAEGKVLYVGKAKILKNRVRSYFREGGKGLSRRIQMMVAQVHDIEWLITANEDEALVLENSHIKSLSPKFNILFRDDKSYPYLRFTSEEFPRISVYRGRSKKRDDCFGPFPSSGAVHDTVALMQKVFLLRTCDDTVFRNRSRACLLYQIKRCSAPCVGHINVTDYALAVHRAKRYVQGHQPEVFEHIESDMIKAAEALDFERAAQCRDQLNALRVTSSAQRIVGTVDDFCDCVVGIVVDGWFAIAFRAIRAGEPVEENAIAAPNPHLASLEEVIAEYLRHRYAKHQIPKKIWVNVSLMPDGDAADDEWLCQLPCATPKRTREKEWLNRLTQQASITLETEKNSQARASSTLADLQGWLGLPTLPTRMECVDISHLSGEGTVGSWVVYEHGKPLSRDYRRYHLKTQGGDDYQALRELTQRRFTIFFKGVTTPKDDPEGSDNANGPVTLADDPSHTVALPDLLVIDGGKGQLSAVLEIIQKSAHPRLMAMPVVGVAKGSERIEGNEEIHFADGRVLHSDLSHHGFKMLLQLRDEAHRFAITGQRAWRQKKNHSRLEDIEGVGPTRRRRLLSRFGSIAVFARRPWSNCSKWKA
jgi:excinuclease ABC subunit C